MEIAASLGTPPNIGNLEVDVVNLDSQFVLTLLLVSGHLGENVY